MSTKAKVSTIEPTSAEANAGAVAFEPSTSLAPSKGALLVKGVATGVAASTITYTGRSVMSTLIKQPAAMFIAGFVAGYFAHKYRKQIIGKAGQAAETGKNFVLHQKESIMDLLAEAQESKEDEAAERAK